MRKGRELELVVEALERCFAPAEAEIKSPDWIPDRITSVKREVDVSIRYKLGSIPVLVILECRDRDSVQDVTWIEQLSKKRDDVQASRAVAVSVNGFSEGAKRKAAHEAIELRTVNELDRSVVLSWCAASQTIGFTRNTDLKHIDLVFASPQELDEGGVRDALARPDGAMNLDAPVFRSKKSGSLVSMSAIWYGAVDQHDLFSTVPPDGSRVIRKVQLSFDAGDRWELVAGTARYEVEVIALTAEMWIDLTQHPISRILEYSSPTGTKIQAVEFDMSVKDKQFVISLYSDVGNGGAGASIRRRLSSDEPPESG